MRYQAGLVDQYFKSSEERLARILLLMAEISTTGEPEQRIRKIWEETLAEMIGTTCSGVSFLMNRLRKLGAIDYTDRRQVQESLLNVVLDDRLPGDTTEEPSVLDSHQKIEKYAY
jgi:hypothetical protein